MNSKNQPKPAAVPTPPSAASLAGAQSDASKDAAVTQFGLNAVNQKTPYGSLTYKQVGKWKDGTPRYEAVTSLSAPEQEALNRDYQYREGVDTLATDQIGRVGDTLSSPFKLGNEATESRLFELGSARLDPKFQQGRDALESKLYNQGVMPGTEAYRRAMEQYGQQENDAYNQLLLTGRQQAANEVTTERNQPLSELQAISGLRSGITQPSFVNTPQSSITAPNVGDYALSEYQFGPLANYNNNQQYQQAQWQQDEQNRQAMLGGIFGLGGAALAGPIGSKVATRLGGWAAGA